MTRSRFWSGVGVVGELLITAAVVLALFILYQLYWTGFTTQAQQDSLDQELVDEWENPRSQGRADTSGTVAFARMYIPAFGSDFRFAVVDGVGDDALVSGPGHYPQTQQFGEDGNAAIAGHRVGHGSPFNDLDALGTCDSIVYETRDTWFEYRILPVDAPDPATARQQMAECAPDELAEEVTSGAYEGLTGMQIVLPSDIGVIDPVPGSTATAEDASLSLTTLTTCHPQFSAAERLIVHAVLVGTEPRVPGEVPRMLES